MLLSKKLLVINLMLICLLAISACSDDDTPEQQVRNFIAAGKLAAEERNLTDFKDLIADDFGDVQGNDKKSITRMAAGYFLRNRNIHLFSQIRQIHFPQTDQAEVQLYVAMTGQVVNDIDSIFNLRADLYRFDLRLVKRDGEWLLNKARWSRVTQESFNSN